MSRKPSIDAEKGVRLFQEYQRLGSITLAARAVGVSPSAASRFFRRVSTAVAPRIVQERAIGDAAASLLTEALGVLRTATDALEARAAEVLVKRSYDFEAYAALKAQAADHATRAVQVAAFLVDVDAIRAELRSDVDQ